MSLIHSFSEYSAVTLLVFGLLAFVAGFVDSIAGGGGLIQLPALLIGFPKAPVPSLFGTNKIAALAGTSIAAWRYAGHIRFDYKLLTVISICSFTASYAGAKAVSYINAEVLKPVIFIVLIAIAVYTFLKKDLGSAASKHYSETHNMAYGSVMGLVVGFYDGFFGPGTGSFLVLGFVVILGFEFVKASAYSKFINCITNISALIVFVRQGNYLPAIAIVMAISNIAGNLIGSHLAIKKGNRFIRIFFLIVVLILIARFGYDIVNGR
jgi:hypothetical protein